MYTVSESHNTGAQIINLYIVLCIVMKIKTDKHNYVQYIQSLTISEPYKH